MPEAESQTIDVADAPARPESGSPANIGWSARSTGIVLGIVSALAYTLANLALRRIARPHDLDWAIWVTANKAVIASLTAWVIIGWRATRGLPALPPRRFIPWLIAAGLLMQTAGNVAFQFSLGLGGLIISVPLVFAGLIVTGALLGRIWLNDPITPRTIAAIVLLMISIVLLAAGAGDATLAVASSRSVWVIILAVVVAGVSGVTYGGVGVLIRKLVTSDLSVSATLVTFSTTGVVVLGTISLCRLGPAQLVSTTGDQFFWMHVAGAMNAVAFFSIAGAMKHITVNHANLLNASQNAMSAAAGVMFFHEPANGWLTGGCLLTIVGILLVGREGGEPDD